MKNPNGPLARAWKAAIARWTGADRPGGVARFQIGLLFKDLAIFVMVPVLAIFLYKGCETAFQRPKKPRASQVSQRDNIRLDGAKSQIIEFRAGGTKGTAAGFERRSPGTVVRVKLLNVVETYSTAPVHVQIVDRGLGEKLLGGTLIGDATPDTNFERITISFRFARDPRRENVAVPIAARALGLDGTLGLLAMKKEGFIARSAFGSAGAAAQQAQNSGADNSDFKQILLKALTAGLVQEFGTESQVERNRANVLTLAPSTEFLAELTDFFPGGSK